MLFVSRGTETRRRRVLLAHVRPPFCLPKVLACGEVIDARSQVDPGVRHRFQWAGAVVAAGAAAFGAAAAAGGADLAAVGATGAVGCAVALPARHWAT